MLRWTSLLLLMGTPLFAAERTGYPHLPSLNVPSCSRGKGVAQYTNDVGNTVPPGEKFPRTQVELCYTDTEIKITFTAFEEVNFFYNASQTTNDPIYEYEVMEAFIYKGTNDPQTYFEFEVNPNNVTWQAFIYNPSKVRAPGAPFDSGKLASPIVDGLVTSTSLDREKRLWISNASIPLGLFNVDKGQAKGTKWRMNFFRIVVSEEIFPNQILGAWSPPDEASFHKTPFFGKVSFI